MFDSDANDRPVQLARLPTYQLVSRGVRSATRRSDTHVRGSLSNDIVVNVEDRPRPLQRNHPLPHLHPQSLSQSDQSPLRSYSSSRPRLTAEAIVRAVSDVFDVANEDPLPARPTRNAGFSVESEYDTSSRDTVTFCGRRARAFRHPILARMGGRPRALGDYVVGVVRFLCLA